ncbi:toxic anion resistance protein [Oceanobacillus arenosus]|uniref:Toxic anion resistance protein n=1 Tax=Oceanobacillus arenosus TaxID=1229153 RepID=A0A3D8PXK1_9BACI|nr:toxic anion resistance protein [Oceanobacillus arenosus]RDW20008.1 toxic anion resistance protein [Oceanobacillus arenosus]
MEQAIPTELDAFENKKAFSTEESERIENIANEITFTNSTAVLEYGAKSQKDVSQFSDKVLEHVRAKDSGEVGQIITDLMTTIRAVDADNLNQKGWLASLPIIGAMFNKAKKFAVRYEKVGIQIERITQQLEKSQIQLIRDITMLDGLYEKNKRYFNELTMYIEAGKLKIKELREQTIPNINDKAEKSNNPEDIQELRDTSQFADRFEKKLHDLSLSRTISLQTAPQIRLIQNNNQLLAEKIQSSILQTIPLWKQQLVIALSLARQQQVLQMQQQVSRTTNEILLKNSEMMKQGSIEIARDTEKGIVDIEILKATQANLIETLEETLQIQEVGRKKREEAEIELLQMEKDFQHKLVEYSNKGYGIQ